MTDKKALIHPKEKTYAGIMKVIGFIFWALILIGLAIGLYQIIKGKQIAIIALIAAVVLFFYAWSWLLE